MAHEVLLGGTLLNYNLDFFDGGFAPMTPSPRANIVNAEANMAYKIDAAGTLSLLTVHATSNLQTASSTVGSRRNLAAGNQLATIGAGVTGFVQDGTHSDAVSAGDKLCSQILASDVSHEVVLAALSYQFAGTSVTAGLYASEDVGASAGALNNGGASVTRYVPVIGAGDNSNTWYISTEANVQEVAVAAGTLSRFGTMVGSNTSTNAMSWTLRKNTANANQTLAIGASATGYIEDTTHSDAVVSGDLLNIASVSGAGTVNATPYFAAMTFTSSGNAVDLRQGMTRGSGNGFSASVANYLAIGGETVFVYGSESDAQIKYPYATTLAHLIAKYSNGSGSGAQALVLRKNGSTGNLAISIDPAVPATVHDTTHSDTIAQNDLVNLMLPAINNSSLSFAFLGLTMNATAAPASKKRRTVFSTINQAA